MKESLFKTIIDWRPLAGRELLWLAALFAAVLLACAAYLFWLPDVSQYRRKNPKTTAFILIKEGQARAQGKKLPRVMIWKDLDDISENLRHAVLVAEDDSFYRHDGIDWESTRKALETDWKRKRLAKGGSTITQQLARNLYLSPSKNPLRKLKEMLIARRLEKELGKHRILELYLNTAEWGRGIYGAEAASRSYFSKSAAELAPEEAAALAAVLPSPRRYNPVKSTQFMERQINRIVGRMRASGYLPEEVLAEEQEGDADLALSSGTAVWSSSAAPAGAY
jgi:monofunctional biosynthetic peptidoglycan transglycosylase